MFKGKRTNNGGIKNAIINDSVKLQEINDTIVGINTKDGERWGKITNCTGCIFVSNFGRIIAIDGRRRRFVERNHIENHNGYMYVGLAKSGFTSQEFVHRLVALVFVKNESNKMFVNHIDGEKNNNCFSNLEWCTVSENNKHSYFILGKKNNIYASKIAAIKNREYRKKRVADILEKRSFGISEYDIAKSMSISLFTVKKAIRAYNKTLKEI